MIDDSHQTCIDACLACALACEQCASACLNESDLQILTRCIELDRECSLACFASARLMSMGGEHAAHFCSACADLCEACAEECEKHEMDHCQRCAEACRNCAEECRRMATAHA